MQELQTGIRTALNKTAAAARNNIHLLFNLACQLAKQAVPLVAQMCSGRQPTGSATPEPGKQVTKIQV